MSTYLAPLCDASSRISEPNAMASSQSEQKGVEAMLGLGLVVAGAGGPADNPGTTLAGEEEDDGPIIPGVMIKGNQERV